MKQAEIRKNGYKALLDSLGVVGMLRSLQQLGIGSGYYTLERHQANEPSLEEFRQFTNIVSRPNPTPSMSENPNSPNI